MPPARRAGGWWQGRHAGWGRTGQEACVHRAAADAGSRLLPLLPLLSHRPAPDVCVPACLPGCLRPLQVLHRVESRRRGEEFEREVGLLKQLHDRNIVQVGARPPWGRAGCAEVATRGCARRWAQAAAAAWRTWPLPFACRAAYTCLVARAAHPPFLLIRPALFLLVSVCSSSAPAWTARPPCWSPSFWSLGTCGARCRSQTPAASGSLPGTSGARALGVQGGCADGRAVSCSRCRGPAGGVPPPAHEARPRRAAPVRGMTSRASGARPAAADTARLPSLTCLALQRPPPAV